ncbi:hypothetical protein LZ30DRAFT_441520 [Colletotrichum cereale]|nr:hypothetical protein LZ30DRAFT_441520 [Colletotrichum cereale]
MVGARHSAVSLERAASRITRSLQWPRDWLVMDWGHAGETTAHGRPPKTTEWVKESQNTRGSVSSIMTVQREWPPLGHWFGRVTTHPQMGRVVVSHARKQEVKRAGLKDGTAASGAQRFKRATITATSTEDKAGGPDQIVHIVYPKCSCTRRLMSHVRFRYTGRERSPRTVGKWVDIYRSPNKTFVCERELEGAMLRLYRLGEGKLRQK